MDLALLLKVVTLVFFVLGLLVAATVISVSGVDPLFWLFGGLVSWTLERFV